MLWIAFNLVSLHLQKQRCQNHDNKIYVVNCFQFSIFAFAKTTNSFSTLSNWWLWIAFNLVSLHLQKQPLLITLNMIVVVNCFQFSIFAFAKTTNRKIFRTWRKLWIAFNLVSLHLQKQRFIALFVFVIVVNCFQFSIFAFAKTTTNYFH